MYKLLINLQKDQIKSYFLINNQLEFVVQDKVNDLVGAIFKAKITKYNANNSLAWINYINDKVGVVNLPKKVKVQTGSEITVQMVKPDDDNKLAKFTTMTKLVGKYVIIYPFNQIPNQNTFANEKLSVIANKYSTINLTFRSCVETLNDYTIVENEINYLLAQLKHHTSTPDIIYPKLNKYLHLIYNFNYANTLSIEANDNNIYQKLQQLQQLYNFSVIQTNNSSIDLSKITAIKYSYIQMHKLSGINLFDVNSGNDNLSGYKINLLAISEIVKAIKLNDLTGIILIDFIKNLSSYEQNNLINDLQRQLSNDWRKSKLFNFTPTGIFELIRYN